LKAVRGNNEDSENKDLPAATERSCHSAKVAD
jgi:hypothetical protein